MNKPEMQFRLNVFASCFAGCIIASLASVLILVKTEVAIFAFFVSVMIPIAFCFAAGVRQLKYLFSIATDAGMGWVVGCMLTPSVAMGPASKLKRIMNSQRAGHDAILPCLVLSTILVLSRAIFVSRSQSESGATNGNSESSTAKRLN